MVDRYIVVATASHPTTFPVRYPLGTTSALSIAYKERESEPLFFFLEGVEETNETSAK
jgi:hypothetical protein